MSGLTNNFKNNNKQQQTTRSGRGDRDKKRPRKEMKRDNETKTGRMPNLWGLVAVMGLFLAVCVKDGSQCELGMRAAGVAFFAAGAYMGGWLSLNEPEQDEQKEKKSNN